MSATTAGAVGGVETAIQDIMKVEPMAATIIGAIVPGAAPFVAAIQPEVMILAPFLINALDVLKKNNGGNVMASIVDLIQHLTPGEANSPILSMQPAINP